MKRAEGCLRLVLVLGLTACSGGREDLPPAVAGLERLTGVWTAELAVTIPLLSHADTTARAGGSIALIPNTWVTRPPTGGWTPTHLGASGLDLRPFGFDPRPAQRVPGLMARFEPPDSVWMMIEPARAGESLRLDGRMAGDSVIGLWHYTFSQGGAAGPFVLRRAQQPLATQ